MSTNLNAPQVTANQNNKTTTINDATGAIDAALTEVGTTIPITSTNAVTVTATQMRAALQLVFDEDGTDPATAASTATFPTTKRGLFIVNNKMAFDLTCTITSQPLTAPVVAAGTVALLYTDGVNIQSVGSVGGNDYMNRLFLGTQGVTGTTGKVLDVGYSPASWDAGTSVALSLAASASADAGGTTDARLLVFNNTITGINSAVSLVGIQGDGIWNSSGTLTTGSGCSVSARCTGGGTVTTGYALGAIVIVSGAGSVISDGRALYARSPSASSGTIASATGLRIDVQKNGANVTKGYGINQVSTADLNVLAGATSLGTSSDPVAGSITCGLPLGLKSYTVATVPSAATAGQMIYVSNESGGATPAFSDGTNWRRVADRAIVS